MTTPYSVVVPTIGRPSLVTLLESLDVCSSRDQDGPSEVIVVDDRGVGAPPLPSLPKVGGLAPRVLRAGGRGPAAARNVGWRAASSPWVVLLDDDVLLPRDWTGHLLADLAACAPREAGSQGRLEVPLPPDRRPTDFERGTAGLMGARWATADMAYRREALLEVGGFDERFPRAYREDADLALRVRNAGWGLQNGQRVTCHPVRPSDDWVSLRVQAGNADDALMRRLHGPRWRVDAEVPRGRLRRHAVVAGSGLLALVAAASGRSRLAAVGGGLWLALTGEFATRRIVPGPKPGEPGWAAEWRRMLLTSAAIPAAAVAHRLAGEWRARRRQVGPWPLPLAAVLLDRDGTLVHDVPYNGDPSAVRPIPGAAEAVQRLRAAGMKVGVVSNQSGIGRGLLTVDQVEAVNQRVDELLGPFDTWQVCPHAPDEGCACRKPSPGLVLQGASALGVRPQQCAVIGDIGADVDAALAAGARSVLVPTEVTLAQEVSAAPLVATSIEEAVDLLLSAASPTRIPERAVAR